MRQELESEAGQSLARILVVDDSAVFRRVVGAMLERAGYRVETAASGEDAFSRCYDEHFDLVVSDITMGALSGVQLCRLFRSDAATREIPVLLLTAADDARSRFWARNAGADAYIAKERARCDLLPEVERILAATRSRRSSAAVIPILRKAQPMERLSHVLDELLFKAVVSSEVRNLVHHTGNRRTFAAEFLQIAAAVVDCSYLNLTLRNRSAISCAILARAPLPNELCLRTRESLNVPHERGASIEVTYEQEAKPAADGVALQLCDKAVFALEAAGESLGTLVAAQRDKALGEGDREILQLLARELGILVKNLFLLEETKRLADHDALTGLSNRRRATERLEFEYARARRYRTPFSVVLCDVDHFKSVNDQFGHNVGDEVLVRVAACLQSALREVDAVCRWGGEEFLVLLPDTALEGASVVAERLRLAIEELSPLPYGPARVTCSLGVAAFAWDASTHALVDRADRALYRAKRTGRNRVELG